MAIPTGLSFFKRHNLPNFEHHPFYRTAFLFFFPGTSPQTCLSSLKKARTSFPPSFWHTHPPTDEPTLDHPLNGTPGHNCRKALNREPDHATRDNIREHGPKRTRDTTEQTATETRKERGHQVSSITYHLFPIFIESFLNFLISKGHGLLRFKFWPYVMLWPILKLTPPQRDTTRTIDSPKGHKIYTHTCHHHQPRCTATPADSIIQSSQATPHALPNSLKTKPPPPAAANKRQCHLGTNPLYQTLNKHSLA